MVIKLNMESTVSNILLLVSGVQAIQIRNQKKW